VVEPQYLRGGERAKVALNWDTSGLRYRQGSDFGLRYKVGDEDDVWFCPLSIVAYVVPYFEIEPKKHLFKKDGVSSQRFTLISRNVVKPVSIVGVYCSHRSLSVESYTSDDVVIVFTPENYEADPFVRYGVFLKTDCETERTYYIPIQVVDD
jgi:hypothetical protein